MSTGKIPQDDRGKAVLALWNDATQQAIPVHVGALVTGSDGNTYAKLDISGSITAANPSVGTDGSSIPTSSTLIGASDGTNLQQLLVESASNHNLRVGLFQAGNEATVTGANALKVDGSGVTQPVSGTITETNSAAILTQVTNHAVTQGAGAAMGTFWRVAGDYAEQASLSAGALNADLVPATDVSAFKSFSLQVTGTWSGVITFQGSNDNTTWNSVTARNSSNSNTESSTASASNIYVGDICYRYLRVRMTSYTSGTATGTLELYTQPLRYGTQISGNVGLIPQTIGGTSTYHVVSAASNNAANVKNSAGQVYGWDISNPSASWRYVKLYNKATAPVPGTDTPIRTIGIAPGAKAFNVIENGQPFGLGIGIAIVAGIADNDNTSVSANDVVVDLDYK